MTVNLMWSDRRAAYLIADSAKTHHLAPIHEVSIVGQRQRLPELHYTVEEGVQKIIRVPPAIGLALCGDEYDAIDMAKRLHEGVLGNSPKSIVDYFTQLPEATRFKVAIATPNLSTAFMILESSPRGVRMIPRGAPYLTGSLGEDASVFLLSSVAKVLQLANEPDASQRDCLVAGLACATAMATAYNLTRDKVGGAFFGALIDEGGFSWQPDLTYFFYQPGVDLNMQKATLSDALTMQLVDEHTPLLDIVSCWVREDVSVAVSTIENRSVGAWSPVMTKDIDEWSQKWGEPVSRYRFSDVDYFVLVPKVPGMIAVVANDRCHVILEGTRLVLSEKIVQELNAYPLDGRYALRVFRR